MNLNKLSRYIEAPGGGMWGPMPEGFQITNEDAIFVKLVDVEALLSDEFVSVGRGGPELAMKASDNNWTLYAWSGGARSPGYAGNMPNWEYFIKKEPNA